MNSRERVIRTLNLQEVDRIPRQLWQLPGVSMFRWNELQQVRKRFPSDMAGPEYRYGASKRARGVEAAEGEYVDAWGCLWRVQKAGVIGEVRGPAIPEWSGLDGYELPWELLDEADLSQVNRSCAESDKFIQVGTQTRPFERMQFLRGTENLYMDLAYGEREVYQLRDRLHEFFLREIRMWADTDVDAVSFMDDWGAQHSLLISPEMWREFYKPLYKDYCDILHAKGKYAFFHSDGNITAIYPELIEIGVDAINSQLFCMDLEQIGRDYSGKIAFWGEIDRQHVLPFGSKEDVRAAVKRAAGALLQKGRTGVIAQCEWGVDDPVENIMTVFEEWDKY